METQVETLLEEQEVGVVSEQRGEQMVWVVEEQQQGGCGVSQVRQVQEV